MSLKKTRPSERILICGLGSQGKAQAKNLRDSRRSVSAYVRPESKNAKAAGELGIPVKKDIESAARWATMASVLVPDSEQPAFFTNRLEPHLPKGAAVVFAHGFTVHYKLIKPRRDLDVLLVAPLAHASAVREEFIAGCGGVPCVIAVAQDATGRAHERAHYYAKGISKAGPFIDSTFAEEVETDLFTEQSVLCGGVPELIRASFETLVEAGYNRDIAYISCLKELRPIVELLYNHSIVGLHDRISDTASFGALTRGPRLINKETKKELKRILRDIRSGDFMREFTSNKRNDFKKTKACLKEMRNHQIEKTHRKYNRP